MAYATDGSRSYWDNTILWGGDTYANVYEDYSAKHVDFYPTGNGPTLEPDTKLWQITRPPARFDIQGPFSGTTGESCTFSAQTTDPDGGYICYVFYWGLEGAWACTSMAPSGTLVSESITYVSPGKYNIQAMARDQYGAWSNNDPPSDHWISISGEYCGGGCPTLFTWNSTGYVDYGVINIHNPTGEDVIREVPVNKEDVSINN